MTEPRALGRVDWMPRLKVWRVIWYKGAADIPAGDYPTKKEAEDALRELVARGNPTPVTPEVTYDKSLEEFRKASREFSLIREAYRAKKIGDEEFLKGKTVFDKASEVADEAETAYIKAKALPKASGNPGFTVEDAKSIGKELGIDFKRYDVEQFRQGLDVELEHCNVTNCNPLLTGKIAQAHLNELPDYYTRLAKMEEVTMSAPRTEDERKSFHERIFGKGSTPPAERLGRGQTVNDLMPMSPESGPPLPRVLGLRWPWKK